MSRIRKYQYVRDIEQCGVPHSYLGCEIHCRFGRETIDKFRVKLFDFIFSVGFRVVLGKSLASVLKAIGLYPAADDSNHCFHKPKGGNTYFRFQKTVQNELRL